MVLFKETLSRSGAIGTGKIEIVDNGEGTQLAMADTMQTMVSQSELTVTAFSTGTGTLKELGAFGSHGFNQAFVRFCKQEQWAIRAVTALDKHL